MNEQLSVCPSKPIVDVRCLAVLDVGKVGFSQTYDIQLRSLPASCVLSVAARITRRPEVRPIIRVDVDKRDRRR